MGAVYATTSDVTQLKSLTAAQLEAVPDLLEQASAKLRIQASRYGYDIDEMIADEETGADYALVVKAVIVQAVIRALDSVSGNTAISQGSETLGQYSYSMTYASGGQSLYFLKNELKDLGIYRKQTYGAVEIFSVISPFEEDS